MWRGVERREYLSVQNAERVSNYGETYDGSEYPSQVKRATSSRLVIPSRSTLREKVGFAGLEGACNLILLLLCF
ncbi:MAG TPA: hypothetical protein DHV65_11350 [Ktedonobacter sp.]|nr:hypothetical protein [Ktedonobacter sp.]